jgi:predicted nucleic-acid-binding Zn-ribbon protein
MKNKLLKLFNKWNDYSKCPKCKSRNQKETNIDRLDGYGSTILESDIVCAECGQYINHYAYGHLEYPETKTEYLKWLWYCGKPSGIKCYIRTIAETLRVIF